MPTYYGYTFAIFGTQSTTTGGASIDYDTPPTGVWRYTGTDTYFVVEEVNKANDEFEGDTPDEFISENNQVGRGQEQTTLINGVKHELAWDYTFTVSDGTDTWRVLVIDVDLNDDHDLEDAGEDGFFLVFPDGMPPADTDLTVISVVEDDVSIQHIQLGAEVVCFAANTLIETSEGLRPVEKLRPGDLVVTRDAGLQPLRWVGETEVSAFGKLAPIVIEQGVLGNEQTLTVSPQHAVLLEDWRAELYYGSEDVLVRAIDLLGLEGVHRKPGGRVRYCHILFDQHQLVRASGMWSESLYPGDMTLQTVNQGAREEIETLFPDLKEYGPKTARCLRRYEAVCIAA